MSIMFYLPKKRKHSANLTAGGTITSQKNVVFSFQNKSAVRALKTPKKSTKPRTLHMKMR